MAASNLLFILSDEHTREIMGCSGNPLARTPHLDRLAARGTRFTSAYCPSPICVPSRASLATGRHVHDIRHWDNAHPYDGRIPGWGHHLVKAGHEVVSVGKLHFRDTQDPNGFSQEILPLHVVDGVGDLVGLIRQEAPPRAAARDLAAQAGPGESTYTDYDRRITRAACDWLRDAAQRRPAKPWVLFVSLVCPHFPLIAPPEFYRMFPPDSLPWPRFYAPAERPSHPAIRALQRCMNYDDYFTDEQVRVARAAYYALCAFLDDNVGTVLAALDDAGFTDNTQVIYSSDHGDNLGHRGLWGKSVMYEESAAVPMIVAGPGLPAGRVVDTPVSLVDCYPTIVETVGEALTDAERALPGRSLVDLAHGADPDRTVLCQYHAAASVTGTFMVRHRNWKYVHYVGMPPQLFDLAGDPLEAEDLGTRPDFADVRAACEARLRAIVDPDAASALAFADQAARIHARGGRDAVLRRGDFGYTPAPGQAAVYAKD